jgi:hypothetical protein
MLDNIGNAPLASSEHRIEALGLGPVDHRRADIDPPAIRPGFHLSVEGKLRL